MIVALCNDPAGGSVSCSKNGCVLLMWRCLLYSLGAASVPFSHSTNVEGC
jgi:hypothetical protein